MVGDNNVINFDSSALSNNSELQRKSLSDLWSERVSKGDAKIAGLDLTKQNMAKIIKEPGCFPLHCENASYRGNVSGDIDVFPGRNV